MSYLATGADDYKKDANGRCVNAMNQAVDASFCGVSSTVTAADLAKIPTPKSVPFWIDPLTGTKYGSGAARAAAYLSGKEKLAREASNRRLWIMGGIGVGALVLIAILAGRK